MNRALADKLHAGIQRLQLEPLPADCEEKLLAYLAFHPRMQAREKLIEWLWPSCAPAVGRNRFSVTLSSLRRQLESANDASAVIVANHAVVGLNLALVTTDVADFEAALRQCEVTDDPAEQRFTGASSGPVRLPALPESIRRRRKQVDLAGPARDELAEHGRRQVVTARVLPVHAGVVRARVGQLSLGRRQECVRWATRR